MLSFLAWTPFGIGAGAGWSPDGPFQNGLPDRLTFGADTWDGAMRKKSWSGPRRIHAAFLHTKSEVIAYDLPETPERYNAEMD
jgi:hypothetical protein